MDNPGAGDDIEQAIQAAAQRYGRAQVNAGRGASADGLARWWLQENAEGARVRAASLIETHDLSTTQLADALVSGNPGWLGAYRRRDPQPEEPADPEAVSTARAAARQAIQPWAPEAM